MGLTGDDVILHTIPLFHVNGWGTPHYLTGLGGVHVLLPASTPARCCASSRPNGVTRLFLVPAMARLVLDHPSLGSRATSPACVQVSVGGAAGVRSLLAELEAAFGCECICGYGMTESCPTLTRSLPKPGRPSTPAQRATTGLPILGVDVRVLGDGDVEVPWDGATVGEICARSNHVMIGYLRRPRGHRRACSATAGCAPATSPSSTPTATCTIVDRAKDLIVSGGENIASVEVEQALEAHPAVREAAVVGVPDERWGEVPRAFVSLVPGEQADEAALIAWVRERLAAVQGAEVRRRPRRAPQGRHRQDPEAGPPRLALTLLEVRAGGLPTGPRGRGRARRRSW